MRSYIDEHHCKLEGWGSSDVVLYKERDYQDRAWPFGLYFLFKMSYSSKHLLQEFVQTLYNLARNHNSILH